MKVYFNKKTIFLIIAIFFFSGCYFWRGSKIIIKRYPKRDTPIINQSASIKETATISNERVIISDNEKNEFKKDAYTIGTEDLLIITVWDNPDLNQDARVNGDGDINYPFIGKVNVAGKTVNEVDEILTGLLGKDLVYDPQIEVTVREYKSKKVFVVGEVSRTGTYYLKESKSLLEMISEAGGIKTDSAGNYLIIKRKLPGSKEDSSEIKIPLIKGELERDAEIYEGDIIKVPEAKFFISGEIGRPGFHPINDDINIFQGIIIAGGFTKAADENNVKLRRDDGKESLLVDLERLENALERGGTNPEEVEEQIKELKLRDGDMIFVPTSVFSNE